MNDVFLIGISILFFALSVGLLNALDGLREDKS